VRSRGLAAPIALHASWNVWQHLFLSPLDASATPLVPTFMHATAGWQYVAMLGVIGAAMIAATVGILQSRRRFA
jgi:hypothetical protein